MQNQRNNELDRLAEELTLCREVEDDGSIYYYNENKRWHRVHGPAVVLSNGYQRWCQNGKIHRLDGPAVIFPHKTKYWYIDGKRYTEEEFNAHPLVIEYAKSK